MSAPRAETAVLARVWASYERLAARLRTVSPPLSILALWFLFELPAAIRPEGIDFSTMRPTGDFLALVTVYALIRGRRSEAILRRVWVALLVVIVLVRVDFSLCWLITRARPLFYDQIFLVRHLAVLVSDLWSLQMAFGLVAIAIAVAATVALAGLLSRIARAAFDPPLRERTLHALGVTWALAAALTLLGSRGNAPRPLVRWIAPELVSNVRESYRTHRKVREGIAHSPYAAYASIKLTRRPSVTIFFVESYGRIIAESPDLERRLSRQLTRMERKLGENGWNMVSGFSTAPVSGGRSWLAVGSIFMGTPVQYESVFRHLVSASPSVPSIPAFFAANGYETIGLEPSDRARPGVEETNYYHLARQIHLDDLQYTGASIGWGLVPDQYSLGFTEESVLAPSWRSQFFMFHMVSSHMPWGVVPKMVEDWRSLGEVEGAPVMNVHGESENLSKRLKDMWKRLGRYGHDELHQLVTRKGYARGFRQRYVDTVAYDLKLIEQHLLHQKADELIIVMGDHQPPAVTSDGDDFDVPVHVFARDPALLAEFVDHGFTSGLGLDAKAPAAVEHAGLFSLLVRDLTRVQPSGPPLPPYLRHGVSLTGD